MLDWLDRLLSNLWWWGLADPPLVYRADFVTGTIEDKIDAPWLWVGTSDSPGRPDQNPVPTAGVLTLNGGGLRLSVTKFPTDTQASVMVALSPKPASLRRFRLVANYSLPDGFAPSGAGNQWAATLGARDGDKSIITDSTTFMGATHQVRGGAPDIALGVGGATATSGPQVIANQLVYPDGLPREFQLQTDLDCDAGLGRSRLYTPYHRLVWRERSWTPSPGFDMGELTAIGVGIGFTRSSIGRPTVLVKDFAIHNYVPQRWWRRTIAATARFGSLALSALRRRTTDDGLRSL